MVGRSNEVRARMSAESTMRAAEQIVAVLGSMKGIAMKLGQMLSLLDLDLVPPEHRESFQRRLAVLRDDAPRVPFDRMRRVIEKDLGAPLDQLFATFDETPVAAASIGQVYRATLRGGRVVAVKVQYPGVDLAVRADLKNLALFGKLIQTVLPWVTPAVIEELRLSFEAELDYRAEARTQRALAEQFDGHPFVYIPPVIADRSGTRVLTTEFVDGLGFEQVRELPADQRDRVGEIVYRFYVGSLYRFDEFCGDPHPGNLLYMRDGRVCFLDFGLFTRMRPAHVRFEAECLRTAAEDRIEDLHALLAEVGIIDGAVVTAEQALEYVLSASEWCLVDQELTITPELASGAFLLAIDPRPSPTAGARLHVLPAEHLFSRRADFLTFGVLGELGATANWFRIAREWLYDDEPATELGRQDRDWWASRAG
ncbi:AarF/ABC1/UbiB kinase family protein [Skermania piniformis]|uniref:AarF/ABC1/UbiB kinase family protein n=2 Tax=Skermania pinensis TaxID=39122 RepID=A0ABX8SCK4_9ACTN|nr:AarF/ABC1/UbiB kinase family protein [Skermania piniformis]